MKRFVVPPNWPAPPRRSWVPPRTWQPDPTWPAAPAGWRFWVDGKGNPVRGPIGRYGGTSWRAVFAGAAAVVLVLAINGWALSAIGVFGDDGTARMRAAPVTDDPTPTQSSTTPTPKPTTPPRTTKPPTVSPSVPKATAKPTVRPTKTRTTTRRPQQTDERPSPSPTRSVTKTIRPPRITPSRTPTREEILRAYCVQQGWDPEWCDPDNWPEDPYDPSVPPPR